MKSLARLSTLAAFGAFALGSLSLQAQETVPGTKASVKLTLTLTEEIGGFLVKTPKVEEGEEPASLPYGEIINPRGFDPEALSPKDAKKFTAANYYAWHQVTKYRTKDSETGEGIDPTEMTGRYVRKLHVTKYGNAQLLADLVEGGVLPGSEAGLADAIRGYTIVAVTFADDEEGGFYFFAEKAGSAPVFLGAMNDDESNAPIALTSYGDVEAINETHIIRQKYKTVDGEVVEDGDPVHTYSEKFNGLSDTQLVLRRGDDSLIWVTGVMSFSGRYDAKSEQYINGPVKLPLAGSAGVEDGEDDWEMYAAATGSISTSAFKVIADVEAYKNALPTPTAE